MFTYCHALGFGRGWFGHIAVEGVRGTQHGSKPQKRMGDTKTGSVTTFEGVHATLLDLRRFSEGLSLVRKQAAVSCTGFPLTGVGTYILLKFQASAAIFREIVRF